jgi:hypothetical protein
VLPTGHYTLTVEKAGFSKLEQKNLSVTVGATVTLSLRYVHTYGDRIPMVIDSNLPAPTFTRTYQLPGGQTFTVPFPAGVIRTAGGQTVSVNLSRLNPNFGALNVNTSIGLAWYNAMLIELKRRFRNGFQIGATYTLALARTPAARAMAAAPDRRDRLAAPPSPTNSISPTIAHPLPRISATASTFSASGNCLSAARAAAL